MLSSIPKVLSTIFMMLYLATVAQAQERADLPVSADKPLEKSVDELINTPEKNTERKTNALPLWEVGLLGTAITHPAYPGADEHSSILLGLPYMIYRGEYLRIDRGNVGVRAIKTPRIELDVGFAASLGARASDVEARRGMDDLGILVEFGPRLKVNLGEESEGRRRSRIQLAMRGVFDLNDHLSYHGIAFEPEWVRDISPTGPWFISTSLGAVYGDQKLADTFYRVSPNEATTTRPAYDARVGLIALRAGFFASRLLNPDVRFFGFMRLETVNGAVNHDSPLVRRDYGWAAGIGLAWTLARSESIAKD